MTIRPAIPDDAPTLCEMIRGLAAFERAPDAVEVSPEILRDQLAAAAPPFDAIVAEDATGIVGAAIHTFTYSTWTGRPSLYLEDLFVWPAARAQGIGRALMARLAQIAVERGCARMDWQVLDWNAQAIGFYDRLGAAPQSAWVPWRISGARLAQLAASAAAAASSAS